MEKDGRKFAQLLTTAIRKIALDNHKPIAVIQDELGYALGRNGGSTIDYWRRGHVPAYDQDVEILSHELFARGGLDCQTLPPFLRSAGYLNLAALMAELCPPPSEPQPEPNRVKPPFIFEPTPSPFVVGVPIMKPRQFFGREAELSRIFRLWRYFPLQNLAVIGLRRSGKTSLLHHLKNIIQADPTQLRPGQRQRADWLPGAEYYQWVYIDFQDIRMRQLESLLPFILAELKLPPPDHHTLANFIETVSRHLQQPTIIMMDEISAGLQAPDLNLDFWWGLRALVTTATQGQLAFLLAGHEEPDQLAREKGKPSPFFNIFGHLRLGPLTEAEAYQFINSSPKPFPAQDIAWILEQSACWPSILQIICQIRLHHLESAQPGNWQAESLSQLDQHQHLLE